MPWPAEPSAPNAASPLHKRKGCSCYSYGDQVYLQPRKAYRYKVPGMLRTLSRSRACWPQRKPRSLWEYENIILRSNIAVYFSNLSTYTSTICCGARVCAFLFSICYYLRPSFSLPLLVVTQIRGHISRLFSPRPTAVRTFDFYREKTSALSSLLN